MTDTDETLRDRKRAQNRKVLAEASLALSLERGIGNVTVAEIVAEADLSRRTFSNYFSCKEEAIADVLVQRATVGLDTWEAPETDSLIELVKSLVTYQMRDGLHQAFAQVIGLARGHHPLLAFLYAAESQVWALATERLFTQISENLDVAQEEKARQDLSIVMGAVAGAMRYAMLSGSERDSSWFNRVAHVLGNGI